MLLHSYHTLQCMAKKGLWMAFTHAKNSVSHVHSKEEKLWSKRSHFCTSLHSTIGFHFCMPLICSIIIRELSPGSMDKKVVVDFHSRRLEMLQFSRFDIELIASSGWQKNVFSCPLFCLLFNLKINALRFSEWNWYQFMGKKKIQSNVWILEVFFD